MYQKHAFAYILEIESDVNIPEKKCSLKKKRYYIFELFAR